MAGLTWAPLVLFASLAIESHQNLTHFNSGLMISRTFYLMQEFLVLHLVVYI